MIIYLRKKLHNLLKTKYPFYNPFYSFYQQYYKKDLGCIYMLHRVSDFDENKLFPNENMKVSPSFLEKLIISYKRKGVEFISLDDLYEFIQGSKRIKSPFIIFTIDDGYLDNYTNAYPIFRKHNIPFTIYISTDFPDRKAKLWWYALEDYILKNDIIILSNGQIIQAKTIEEKNKAFLDIRNLILKIPQKNIEDDINSLLKTNIDLSSYVDKLAMNWEQIKELSKDSLCTIAGHTVTHPAFKTLKENEIKYEIEEGCQRLKNQIGKDINHFAYPYGSTYEVGEKEYLITEKYNFKTITTTLNGTITLDSNLQRLKRIMLSEF